MDTDSPNIRAAAQAAYAAYGDHADWKAYNGSPMPTWENLPDDTRAHWCAAIAHLVTEVEDVRQVIQQAQVDAAHIAAAGLFQQTAKCLVWSNQHGGWWRKGQHGYTLDLADAHRFTVDEAQAIVMKAGADALNPRCKGLPEIGVLAPEERWDSAPQVPDGAMLLDVLHQVTGETSHRYLPFSLEPHQLLQRVALQLYGEQVFVQGLVAHEGGALHTICRRLDDDEPSRVDLVEV